MTVGEKLSLCPWCGAPAIEHDPEPVVGRALRSADAGEVVPVQIGAPPERGPTIAYRCPKAPPHAGVIRQPR